MGFLTSIGALFIVIFLSLLVCRIGTVALTHTGLSRDMARFQANSAFTTSGFTTIESENVVNHPVRRHIISLLMFLGNVGFVGIVATTLVSITSVQNGGDTSLPVSAKLAIIAFGLVGLGALSLSKWVDDFLFKVIGVALKKFTHLEAHDLLNLLQIGQGFTVTELALEEGDWLVGQRLDELRLSEVGVNILGIKRSDSTVVGTPTGNTYLRKNDRLIVYGSRETIIALDMSRTDPEAGERHKQLIEERREKWRKQADTRADGYDVREMVIRKKSWMVGQRLDELRLPDVGINILGIKRFDGTYIGTPAGMTVIRPEDKIVVYGAVNDLEAMDLCREDPEGAVAHARRAAERRAEVLRAHAQEERKAGETTDTSDLSMTGASQ